MKRIYLDVEIQNVENPGYAPLTRGNDYLSRMITSQNGKEYDYRNYDGMKKAYVIWILPQAAKKRDGHVNRINSKLENISGSTIERLECYDKSEQIMIYLNKDHDIKDKYEDSDWIKTPLVIFLNNTYDLLIKKEVIKAAPKGSAYDELQEMIGLSDAKQVIQKALNYYKMQKLYEEKGVKRDRPAMHMVFTGNPGTAKTTVARLFARIMKENGLLSKGQLIEVGRADLVGKYVGWTAPTVKSKFKAALGGVLFIDEAYSLVEDRDGLYGDEAINTIVQEMENHRDDVVVIFAGYPDKMEGFLQKNPGLRSRIAFHVPFADYNSEELCCIAKLIGKNKGLSFSEDAVAKLETIFDLARQQNDFGNGRYVRNILEQARMSQATRLMEADFDSITTEDVVTIKAEDIAEPKAKPKEKRRIGFVA